MRNWVWLVCLACGLTCLTLVSHGEAPPQPHAVVAYRGARILTAEGPPIDNGVLVVQGGKITAVGPADDVAVPADATVIDLSGKTIIPGLVDTHSHIGIWPRPDVPAHSDGNEASGPVQGGLRALDAIQPDDPGIRMAVAGGVTTANIMPGSGNVIGGQTLYVKLRGHTVEAMAIQTRDVLGGLKMANGENPKRFNFDRNKSAPATRMKLAALQREQFIKARDYQRRWQEYRKKAAADPKAEPPERDISLEPLVEVLERKRTVHFHCHRGDDLLTAVRLADEFDFEIVLQHATEGYRVVEELVKYKVPVSLTLLDSPGGKLEAAGLLEENAALLEQAGVKVAINTDDSITESRFFLRTGAIAVRGGMSEDVGPARPDSARRPDAAPRPSPRLAEARARTPTSSSCPARPSASTPRSCKLTSMGLASSTARGNGTGRTRRAASPWPMPACRPCPPWWRRRRRSRPLPCRPMRPSCRERPNVWPSWPAASIPFPARPSATASCCWRRARSRPSVRATGWSFRRGRHC